MAVTLTDSGLQFDSVQTGLDDDSPVDESMFAGSAMAGSLPADTLGDLSFSIPANFFQDIIELAAQSTSPFDPSGGSAMVEELDNEFQQEFGLSLVDDLLPSLGPGVILAVVESMEGMLAQEMGAPLGAILAMELSDPGPMRQLLPQLEGLIASQGVDVSGDDPRVVSFDGTPVVAYSVSDTSFVLGTSGDLVDDFLGGEGGLTSAALYQEVDAALGGDGMSAFFDLESIFDELPIPADERAVLAPLRAFGASSSLDGDTVIGRGLLLIDY